MPSPSPSSTIRSSPTRSPASATRRRRTRCSARTSSASARCCWREATRDAADGRRRRSSTPLTDGAGAAARRAAGRRADPARRARVRPRRPGAAARRRRRVRRHQPRRGDVRPQALRQQAAGVAGRPAGDRRSTRCSPPAGRSCTRSSCCSSATRPSRSPSVCALCRARGHRAPARRPASTVHVVTAADRRPPQRPRLHRPRPRRRRRPPVRPPGLTALPNLGVASSTAAIRQSAAGLRLQSAVVRVADACGCSGEITPRGFREPGHVPADLSAGAIAVVVGGHLEVAPVPPRVSRLDREHRFRPGDVEVDHLAGRQRERVLALRLW